MKKPPLIDTRPAAAPAWTRWPLTLQLLAFWACTAAGAGLWAGSLWLLAGRPDGEHIPPLWQSLYLLGLYLWLLLLCRRARRDLGLAPLLLWRPRRQLLGGAGLALVTLSGLFALGLGLGWARPGPVGPEALGIGAQVAVMALAIASIEEIVFRGLMLDLALRRTGSGTALTIQAGIYAGLHLLRGGLDWPARIQALLALGLTGWLLGKLRLRTGSLAASVGLHGGWIAVTSFSAWTAWLQWQPASALWSGLGNPIYGLSGLPVLLGLNLLVGSGPNRPAENALGAPAGSGESR